MYKLLEKTLKEFGEKFLKDFLRNPLKCLSGKFNKKSLMECQEEFLDDSLQEFLEGLVEEFLVSFLYKFVEEFLGVLPE